MIFVIPECIFNGRKQTIVDTIGILSALCMRGLHDKRHLLAKLRICGSENCYEITVQLHGKVNIYVHSLEKIEERRKWGIYTKWGLPPGFQDILSSVERQKGIDAVQQ